MKDEREAHEPVTVRLPVSLAAWLREQAKREDRTISAIVKIELQQKRERIAEAA